MEELIEDIAEYVSNATIDSAEAYETAHLCLADSIACAALSTQFDACTKLLGPVASGTIVPDGSSVPCTNYLLDPIRAAFNIGTMIRWLDFNDTFLAKEWGHPSDNLGGILAVGDFVSKKKKFFVRDLLTALIKAYEIQGVLSLDNSLNSIGLDHVLFVKVATTAVTAQLLGATKEQIADALSQAWIDIGPLRTYRHAPNTGSRKSWAAGDATSRGVQLAFMTMQGEKGYPQPLSAPRWGLYDTLFQGRPLVLSRPLGSYIVENILFKVSFPAEFHAQTAVECALHLHPRVIDNLDSIERIEIETQEPAMRIIHKTEELKNPADRDHCLEYMVAIALIYGTLTAEHYEDSIAQNPQIDQLRSKMVVKENKQFTQDYLDPAKRSIANTITLFFANKKEEEKETIEYPIGHRRRRDEALPLLNEKWKNCFEACFPQSRAKEILDLFQNRTALEKMPVDEWMKQLIKQ